MEVGIDDLGGESKLATLVASRAQDFKAWVTSSALALRSRGLEALVGGIEESVLHPEGRVLGALEEGVLWRSLF